MASENPFLTVSFDAAVAAPVSVGLQAEPILDAVACIVWVTSPDGAAVHFNRAWYDYTGLSAADSVGYGWIGAVHPEDRSSSLTSVEPTPATEPRSLDFRLQRSDGTFHWVRGRRTAVRASSGAIAAWVQTCSDIDLQRSAETQRDALRTSESALRRLFESNVVGIVIATNDGSILEANDALLDAIGYSRDDLAEGRLDWRHLTPAEWLPLDELAIDQLAVDGFFSQYEKEYYRKDGSRVPVSLGGARIAGTDDRQICYIIDLTEQRRSEAALRRSEARFRSLSDANVIGIMSVRLSDGVIAEANDEFLRMVGYDREDVSEGRLRWEDLTPAVYREADERAIREVRELRRFTPFEKEYIRKDGSTVPFLVGGAMLDGSDDETICYLLDLTGRREAIRRTQESEQRYRMLTEALPQIVILTNEERRPIFANRNFSDYTGASITDSVDGWRSVVHPDDLASLDAARSSLVPYSIEIRLKRASDQSFRWHFLRTQQIPAEPGGAVCWLATAMDIDDRKRAEEALRFIDQAGSLLSQSLDLQTTLDTLLDLVVPSMGDWASINLREDLGIRTIAARHSDPAKAHLMRRIVGSHYYNEDSPHSTPAVFRTGKPQAISNVSDETLRSIVKESYFPIFKELGVSSLIVQPILAGDDVIGSFGIVSSGDARAFTQAENPVLQELARRAATAIVNARLYEREHRVAEVLQKAALPGSLPLVDGLILDGFYQPGRDEAAIGGDWFDALVLSDGRLVVTIGDVAGSGLGAAVTMASMRQVLRGVAYVQPDPMVMLEAADRALLSEHESRMVTVFVAVIEPSTGDMRYASGGHPPPLLREAGGSIFELSAPGLPLGYRRLGPAALRTATLTPGSSLLLYTDGLVEASHDIRAGETRLRACFGAAIDAGAAHPARDVVRRVLEGAPASDDVAALVVLAPPL